MPTRGRRSREQTEGPRPDSGCDTALRTSRSPGSVRPPRGARQADGTANPSPPAQGLRGISGAPVGRESHPVRPGSCVGSSPAPRWGGSSAGQSAPPRDPSKERQSVRSPVRLRPAPRTIGQDVVNRYPTGATPVRNRASAQRPGRVPAQRYGAGVRRASCGSQARHAPVACGPPTPGGSSAARSLPDPEPPGPRRGDRGLGPSGEGRFPSGPEPQQVADLGPPRAARPGEVAQRQSSGLDHRARWAADRGSNPRLISGGLWSRHLAGVAPGTTGPRRIPAGAGGVDTPEHRGYCGGREPGHPELPAPG